MAQINLLPWREEQRKQQSKEFTLQALLAAAFCFALVLYGQFHVSGMLQQQNNRNQYLELETQKLLSQLNEIKNLENTKKKLLSRMDIIQRLQIRRPQVVHLFHELAATLPNGSYLRSIKQNGNTITLEGLAESNARVSAYMRNLSASGWLTAPRLEVIETDKSERISYFKLHLQQTAPRMNSTEVQ